MASIFSVFEELGAEIQAGFNSVGVSVRRSLTSTPTLQDFDMVAAVSQASINTQLNELFHAKDKHGREIIQRRITVNAGDAGVTLTGTIGTADGHGPWVNLGAGDARSALFYLPIQSGTIEYWGFDSAPPGRPVKKKAQFSNLVYAFRTNLNLVAIRQNDLRDKRPVPPLVQRRLQHFNDSMFTVHALLMDFQNANITAYDAKESRIPKEITDAKTITNLTMAIQNYFTSLRGSKNPYVLGYTVRQNDARSDPHVNPTFVPTGATFSTFKDPHKTDQNALNFLIMTGGSGMPAGAGKGIFSNNWLRSDKPDGRFAVDERLLFETWFLPTIQSSLGLGNPKRSGNSWTMSSSKDRRRTYGDKIGCPPFGKVDLETHTRGGTTIKVKYENMGRSKARILIEGHLWQRIDSEFQCLFIQTNWAKATLDLSVTVTVTAGRNGQLHFAYDKSVGRPSVSKGGNWVSDMNSFFGGMQNFGSNMANNLASDLSHVASRLGASLQSVNSRFVMPGGGTFFFSNPQFGDQGDLMMDISYKS